MALDDELLDAELEAGGQEIQYDYSEPDFTEDGRDYWEHYHYVVEPGQVLLRIDKYLVESTAAPSRATTAFTPATSSAW